MFRTMFFKQIVTCYVHVLVICVTAIPYENLYGPEYGVDWILFQDDDGNTHIMNFSTIPIDTHNMIFGDAYYFLYTRNNVEPEELHVPTDDEEIFTSQYFNSTNLIKVLTHGWYGYEQAPWLQNIKNELLIKDDLNVITIDWSELSRNPAYPWSAFSTRYVGKKTASLLDTLAETYQVEGGSMHLLGHSLGSHVMAFTALFSNQRINRITGLDPARPLFEFPMLPADYRLDKSDAEFVDIIHTCGGLYGYWKSQGHADFYPNDGTARQPGCEGLQEVIEGCSHGRSHAFFHESINSEILFNAYPCESWEKFVNEECKENSTYMGYQAGTGDLGDYYLYTNEKSPYARGQE